MKELLALIESRLRDVDTVVTCPICGNQQSFELADLRKIRLGHDGMYTGTGGSPMVQCEHCKEKGHTTLLRMNNRFYDEIRNVVLWAIDHQPAKYIDADFESTEICVSK